MKAELLPRIINNIAAHEGRKANMYLDSVGVVTCGVGHAIFKCADALLFTWYKVDRPATKAEIIADFTAVKYSKRPGSLFLPVEEQDFLLAHDLSKFDAILEDEFPEIASYPDDAVVALFDIAFNCGSLAKWPKLSASVKVGNWADAANESKRPQVGAARNMDTFRQFSACVTG